MGAFLAAGYPKLKFLYKWYYPLRLYKKSELSIWEIIRYINLGIEGYKTKKIYCET